MKILFSRHTRLIHDFLIKLFDSLKKEKQVIIIDPKRTWNGKDLGNRFLVFQPKNLDEFVKTISNLNLYISPRLSFLIIDDFHYYLRDYRGRSAKNVVINNRIFALCLTVLTNIPLKELILIGTTYENPLKNNYPLSHKIIQYYNCDSIQIISRNNDLYLLKRVNGNEFQHKF